MNIICWNCQRTGSSKFLTNFKELTQIHNPRQLREALDNRRIVDTGFFGPQIHMV